MSTLVLVHGFWHGSWCWSEVIPHVVAAGRPAVAVDLAGHGLYARRPQWFTGRTYDPLPEAADDQVAPLLRGNPARTGALRLGTSPRTTRATSGGSTRRSTVTWTRFSPTPPPAC